MFRLTAAHPLFSLTGLALVLLQIFLFVFGLPPFKVGIWTQTEPVLIVMFIGAALNAFWLGTGILRKWLEQQPLHPVWLCLLAFVAWQVLATAFASSPWRSWFGPPQLGEGTAWWLSLLLLVSTMWPLWQEEKYRRVILAASALSIAIQAALCVLYPFNSANTSYISSWAPAPWTSYLGFVAGYFWVILIASGVIRTPGRYCLLIIGIFLIIFVSRNKSSLLLIGGAILVSTLLTNLKLKGAVARFFEPGRKWKIAAMAGCLLPCLWIVYSITMPLPQRLIIDVRHLYDNCDGALTSRIILNRIGVDTVRNEPERLLMGDGWGRFLDDSFKYTMTKDIHAFHNGARRANCFLIDGISLHSHSQPLEILAALGLPGVCLWFALQMMIIYYLPERLFWRCAPMCVGLTAINFLWFQLAQGMVFHALFLVALLGIYPALQPPLATGRPGYKYAPLMGVAALYLGLLTAWSAWQQWRVMQYGDHLNYALLTTPAENMDQWLKSDFDRGGERWQSHALFFTLIAAEKSDKGDFEVQDHQWMELFMNTAREAARLESTGASVASAELWLYYELLSRFKDARYDDLRRELAPHMEEAVFNITRKAPLREDYTALYLVQIDKYYKDPDKRAEFLERMLAIAPEHRGALWVLGNLLVITPGREDEGVAMLEKAASLGVQHVFPVTDKDLQPYKK
jgi:hypothetical protein